MTDWGSGGEGGRQGRKERSEEESSVAMAKEAEGGAGEGGRMQNAMEEGPRVSVSVRVANYEFKGKINALGWPGAR